MWFGVLGPSWSRGSMTDGSCRRAEAGFEAKVNRTREGEMGRGEIGSAGRSVGQLDWIGLASQAVGGWAVGVPDSWDPTMGVGPWCLCVAAQPSAVRR